MKQHYRKLKRLYGRYERLLIPGMLLFGFLLDLITFKSLNVWTAFILLGVHALIVGSMIVFLNSYDEGLIQIGKRHPVSYLKLAAPLLLQFSFGALLSGALIFYLFSSTFSVSWPFFFIIGLLMVSNEIYKEYYLQIVVQLSVYYIVLFSLGAVILPYVFSSLSPLLFVAAGLVAIVLIYLLYQLILKLVPQLQQEGKTISYSIVSLFGLMLVLYFTNIIPPIPLALRDAGAYHSVVHSVDAYLLTAEKETIFEKLIPGKTIHVVNGDPVYVFTALFAPPNLHARIVHEWERYDEQQDKWVTQDEISYNILGGRKDGHRGYTLKTSLIPGRWRVNIKTERGQVVGRVKFKVKMVQEAVAVEQIEQ